MSFKAFNAHAIVRLVLALARADDGFDGVYHLAVFADELARVDFIGINDNLSEVFAQLHALGFDFVRVIRDERGVFS